MRSCRAARTAHQADDLPRRNDIANLHLDLGLMPVACEDTMPMIEYCRIAAYMQRFRQNDDSTRRCIDRGAGHRREVRARVPLIVGATVVRATCAKLRSNRGRTRQSHWPVDM